MTEQQFKDGVRHLHRVGVYPGPTSINDYFGRQLAKRNNINGRECKWRDEVFAELGIKKKFSIYYDHDS